MMYRHHALLSISMTSLAAVAAYSLVGYDNLQIAADDAPVKGQALNPADEAGIDIAVMAIGLGSAKAVGAVGAGDELITAAAGGVKVNGGAAVNVFARALNDAADGELVEFVLK